VSGSLPILRHPGGVVSVRPGLQSARTAAEGLPRGSDSSIPIRGVEAADIPPELRGASRSAGPRLRRYDWPAALRVGGSGPRAEALIRDAKLRRLPALPVGTEGFKNFALNKQARDDVRIGPVTIWRRDGRYKAVLERAGTLANLYEAKPEATQAEFRTQLHELKTALGDFDRAVRRYEQRASPARRDLMATLSDRTRIEIAMLERIEADFASGTQSLQSPGELDSLGRLLGYIRAGLSPDDTSSAYRLGIHRRLVTTALESDRAVDKGLPLATLALLVRHADRSGPGYVHERLETDQHDDIRRLTALHSAGWSHAEIDQALTLGLPLEEIFKGKNDSAFMDGIAPRFALLRALSEAQSPGQDLLEWSSTARIELRAASDTYREAQVPLAWVGPAWTAGVSAHEVRALIDAGLGLEAFKAALAVDIPLEAVKEMALKGRPPIGEIATLMSLHGEGLQRALERHASQPDDAALGWLRSSPASGRPLSRPEAGALQMAGLPDGSLTIEDLVGLIDYGVSAAAIVALAKSPPDPALVHAMLALDAGGRPAFSRAQALLLAGAGWPADAGTQVLFGACYENGSAIVPINEQSVTRDLGRGKQAGPGEQLGQGQFNQVFAVNFADPETGVTQPAVFKPLQQIDPENVPAALAPLGVSKGSPRYELRNLAHSKLDALLGFDAVPRCEVAVVDGKAGLLMALAQGRTVARLGKWVPPLDISDSQLGYCLLQMLRQNPGNTKLLRHYALKERVDIEVAGTADNPVILLKEGLYIPPLNPADAGAQRSLIALQWLHAISGSADGHDKNIIRSEDGRQFVGIDNDLSFGSKIRHADELKTDGPSSERPFHGQGLPPIADRTQYEAIMGLSTERLRTAIGNLITPAEFQATLARLRAAQDHLRRLDREGRIIAADAWDEQSFRAIRDAADEGEPSYLHRLAKRHDYLGVDAP
jgi:hypothetical protein